MFRSILCSLVVMGLCVSFAAADKDADSKDKTAKKDTKKGKEAKITKVDAKTHTVTLKMKHKGKEVEKTFKLAEDIEYVDSTGKVASVDIFTSGDMVLVIEREGKICKMCKKDKSGKKSSATEKPSNK